ncbi:MAG: hypothetical protein ABIX37_12645 [Gammaproteobacteria bacterium]
MTRALLLAIPLLLAACSGPPDTPPAPSADEADNVIGAPLQQSLDKANSVEGLNGQRKDDLDDAVDQAN